jgi:mitochondrial fission protein ELM1
MGNKRISSYDSSQEYADDLFSVMGNPRKVTDHFAAALYNTNVNYYRPKRNIFKMAVKVLIAGIAIAVFLIIYQKLTS